VNEVADQETDVVGLTNLADGECLYVDLDRATNHTVVGGNALVAAKAPLASLGGSSVPGQRWTIATRIGTKIYIRDQSYPVGSSFSVATTTHTGVIRTTINANGTLSDPVAVGLADSVGAYYTATCGGISHNTDKGTVLVGSGDIVIGRGSAAGDGSIFIQSDTEGSPIVIYGKTQYDVSNLPAVKIIQDRSDKNGEIATFGFVGGSNPLPSAGDVSTAITSIGVDGSIGMSTASIVPKSEVSSLVNRIVENKIFFRQNKTYYGTVDAILDLHQNPFAGWTWNATTKTWTRDTTAALISDDLLGNTPTVGMKVIAYSPNYYQVAQNYAGFFTITNIGGGSDHAILTLYEGYPLYNGVTVYNNAILGTWNRSFIKIDTPDPILYYTSPIRFILTTSRAVVQQQAMWGDGSTSPLAESFDPITLG